jgi:hypothetical protein
MKKKLKIYKQTRCILYDFDGRRQKICDGIFGAIQQNAKSLMLGEYDGLPFVRE